MKYKNKVLSIFVLLFICVVHLSSFGLVEAQTTPQLIEDDSVVLSKLGKLKCIDNKIEYSYDEDSIFNIEYNGNDKICFIVGVKILKENKWVLFAPNMGSISSGYVRNTCVNNNETTQTIFYKKRKIGLEKGAKMMLFAWRKSPLSHGIRKDLCQFNIIPKENK